MGNVTQETKDRIRNEVSFADVLSKYTRTNKPGMNRAMWFCPFHDDVRSPAMSVEVDRQIWHCFVCDMGGDIFKFVMEKENLGFKESVRLICDQYGIEYQETDGGKGEDDESRSLYSVVAEAERFFRESLEGSEEAKAYLDGRSFMPETVETWGIGWAPGHSSMKRYLLEKGFTEEEMKAAKLISDDAKGRDFFYNRVMFPIHNAIGRPIAFGGRIMGDGNPKYLNSVDNSIFHKRNTLFGMHVARKAIGKKDSVVVAEGYVDAIMLHQAGVDNAVATLGTAVTNENLANLARMTKNIYLSLDNDAPGRTAARRVAEALDGTIDVSLFALVLPDEQLFDDSGEPLMNSKGEPTYVKDPDDYFNRARHTAEDYLALLSNAPNIFTFVVDAIVTGYDLTRSSDKERAYEEAVTFLREHDNAISMFQGLAACELLVKRLDLGMSGYELSTKLLSGKAEAPRVPDSRRSIDSSLELNVLRLLMDYPKKHRMFERDVIADYFQDPTNYVIYQRVLEAINAREDLDSLHFPDDATEESWARFLMTHPPTEFDERQAETAITRNINAMRKLSIKALIEHLSEEPEPDMDRIIGLKMELSKIR